MKKLFAITSLAFLTSTAFAAEAGKSETGVDYNELSASYVSMDLTSGSTTTTLTGYGLAATYLLTENFFVLGSYTSVEKSPTTIATTSGSVGMATPQSHPKPIKIHTPCHWAFARQSRLMSIWVPISCTCKRTIPKADLVPASNTKSTATCLFAATTGL